MKAYQNTLKDSFKRG